MHSKIEKLEAFSRLLDVMDTLRSECPWDKKQTNESLRSNSIEEVFELADAILQADDELIKNELGDVLLHIVFYSKIGEEKGSFDIASVCNAICNKLIYRHPHVYASTQADDADAVARNWEQIKLKEKDGNKRVLAGVPRSLPSMVKAQRIQDKARGVGFDWKRPEDVWDKVQEEYAETRAAIQGGDANEIEREFGDLLFSIVNAARLYGVNPDNALELCNQKFIRRFSYLEERALDEGKRPNEMTLDEMDALWNEAKAKGL